tara:strand:- start:809 stop:1219 length:411 start_codon:yes stop_codon:yes gene_type:complete
MVRTKRNNKTKRVRNKKGRKTKRRTRRNRQRGGNSLREYMSSARDKISGKISGSFQKLRERFTRNEPESSVEKINRLRGAKRSGKSNTSLHQYTGRNANERTAKLRNIGERSLETRIRADDFLASARKIRQGVSEQ